MGNKKRKSNDEESSDSVRKKKKKPEADFTTTDFRSLLKTNPSAAFEVFISCAKRRESENDFDIVDEFCRSSVDCDDIFKILNAEKFVANDVHLIIEWLHLLLSRVAGDLKKHRPAMHPVVRHAIAYVSGPRAKWLLAMKNKSSHLKAFLKLMTSIVRQGAWAGREIATWFEVNSVHLVSLLNRRDLRDEEDVKTCLIELIASLLACDDYSVIRRLLEIKGFLNKVVADLNGDKASAVVLFLTVLHRKVICNPNITKTSKIHFFHEQTLTDLCKLYRWSGPKHWKEMNRKPRKQFSKGAAEADDAQFDSSNVSSNQAVVREATHLLLKDLCCSIKNGIVFHDKSFATSGQNLNHILTNFLNVLWKPDKDVLVFDLLTEILCSSPDQLQFYLPSLRLSCTPRCTSGWIQSAAFVRKIYEKQPLISPAAKYFSSVTVDELVAMILSTVLPPGDLWSCFKEAAATSWMPVVHESLSLVAIVVKRLAVTVKHIRKLSEDGANLYFDANHFQDLITEAFLKELPEISTLMKYWECLVSSLDSGKSKTDDLVTNHSKLEADDHEIQEAFSEVPVSGRLTLVLRLMCGYFTLFPKLSQTVLDVSCFLDGLEKAEKQCSDEMLKTDGSSYLYLLHLLSLSGVQLEDLIVKSSAEKPSIFESLLDMMISDDKHLSSRMKDIIYRLLTKLMTSCSLFSRSSEEVEIWLKHLMSLSLEQRRDCVNLFISSVKELLKSSVLTAANALEKQSSGLSGLAMVILKLNKDQDEFVDGVLVDIFHLHHDPSVLLCKAVKKSKLPRFSGLLNRLKCSKVESSAADLQSPDLMSLLEKCFVFGLSLTCTDLYQSAVSLVQLLPLFDCSGIMRQIISYLLVSIRQFIQGDKSRKEEIMFYLNIAVQVAEQSRNLAMKQSGHDELSKQIVNEDDLFMLNIAEHDGDRVFCQLCSAMFRSAVVEKYFLWKIENDPSCENPAYARKVSELVTRKFSAFVQEISAFLSLNELHIFEIPVSRVEEAVKNFTIESCKEEVLDAVKAFISFTRPSVVKDFAEKLLLDYKTHLTEENGKLNEFGMVFLMAFRLLAKSNDGTPKFSDEFLAAAFDWADFGSMEYCDLLVLLVKKLPMANSFIQRDTINRLLEIGSHDVLSVVAELVCNNSRKCLKQVSKWITGNKKWKKRKDDYQNLVYEVTKRSSEDKVLCETVFKAYWKHLLDLVCNNGYQDFDSNHGVPANFLRQLIAYADSDDSVDGVNECWKRLTSALFDRLHLTPARVRFYFTLCEDLLAWNVSELQIQCCHFVNTCIQLLTTQLGSKIDDDDDASILVLMNGITKLLEVRKLETANLQECLRTSWDGFLKAGLRHRSTDCHFLKLLETLIGQLYPPEDDETEPTFKSGVLPEDIFELIIGLSHFLPTVLKVSEDNVKDGMISLLYCLVHRSSRCCKASHIGFLLGAYGATLSATDQRILMLLHCYEIAGCSMTEFKPYFWGPRAIENHASNKTLGMSLLPENRMEQIIDLLDKSRVYRSILNFPLRRRLEFGDKVRDANFLKTCEGCYDPVFLLPLFNHLFEPGSAVNCVKFIESHCLGFVVASLSCYNLGIRSLAYHTLSAFQKHLDRSRFPERLQVSYVLECLHISVKEPNQKFASIITVFLAKAIDLMLSPKDHMYSLINEFLLLKPAMDVTNVPEFYKLFYATGLEFKTERLWILNLLLDGLRDTHDYHIMEKRLTFKIIMTFYTFAVSDHASKMVVLKILTKACGIKTVAKDLIENHGLLSWIANVSADIIREKRSAHMTAGVVSGIVEMLFVLWTTVAVTDHSDRISLQPVVTAEMVATFNKVYRHFQNSLGETARETCEKMMLFVKEYSRKTCELYPEWKDVFE